MKSNRLMFVPNQSYLLLAVALAGLCAFGPAAAEISAARAEYLFGPETARKDACELAIAKARSRALANVMGEFISSEELLSCQGATGKRSDYGCDLNQITWSQIEGEIRRTLKENTRIEEREGASACIADVEVEIVIPKEKPDPNFQLRADFGQTVFRVGDRFNLDIELSQPGYFAVFNWLPHDSHSVVRVIPNTDDPAQSTVQLRQNRSKGLKESYSLVASWADSYTGRRKFYDEYLIVVATKKPQRWMSQYSLDDFKALLQQIPITERRLVKKGYQLTKQ
ncbi:hypothetical protein MCEMAEM21_01224 [Oxalobacteraceae bacterium]